MVSAPRAREREVGVPGPLCFQLLGERDLSFPPFLPGAGGPAWSHTVALRKAGAVAVTLCHCLTAIARGTWDAAGALVRTPAG